MKVVLVGQMAASTNCLKKVEEELKRQNVEVVSFLANGQPFKNSVDEINEAIRTADVVLTGMASAENLAKEEIAAAETAAEMRIPYGFYADTYGVIRRPWFASLREKARFIFVINDEEATEAHNLFPNAAIVVSGNPSWEDFFAPKMSREKVRKSLEVSDEEYMVLCPGGKNLTVNILHWGGVVDAFKIDAKPVNWKIFLALHPGDQNKPEAYQDLIKYSEAPVRVVPNNLMSASDMLPGADVVIESASALGIEAACQRKPLINYFSEIALARLEEQTGSRIWPPCEMGVSKVVNSDPGELINSVLDLFLYDDAVEQRKRQEEVYPQPPEKGAVRKIAEALVNIFAR